MKCKSITCTVGLILCLILLVTIILFFSGRSSPEIMSPNDNARPGNNVMPDDWASLLGVSSGDAPNEILYEWRRRSSYPANDPDTSWQENAQFNIVQGTFDATDYVFDEALINHLKVATEIKWLLLGPQTTGADLEWIKHMTWLRGLSLWGVEINDGDLSQLEKLSNLEWLDLSKSRTVNQTTEMPELPNLEVLIMRFTGTNDEQLPDQEQYPNLRVLDLSGYSVTDAGVAKICRAFPQLRYLSLYGQNQITTDSINSLSRLQNLEFLQIGDSGLRQSMHSSGVSGANYLRSKLPNCFIDASN